MKSKIQRFQKIILKRVIEARGVFLFQHWTFVIQHSKFKTRNNLLYYSLIERSDFLILSYITYMFWNLRGTIPKRRDDVRSTRYDILCIIWKCSNVTIWIFYMLDVHHSRIICFTALQLSEATSLYSLIWLICFENLRGTTPKRRDGVRIAIFKTHNLLNL